MLKIINSKRTREKKHGPGHKKKAENKVED